MHSNHETQIYKGQEWLSEKMRVFYPLPTQNDPQGYCYAISALSRYFFQIQRADDFIKLIKLLHDYPQEKFYELYQLTNDRWFEIIKKVKTNIGTLDALQQEEMNALRQNPTVIKKINELMKIATEDKIEEKELNRRITNVLFNCYFQKECLLELKRQIGQTNDISLELPAFSELINLYQRNSDYPQLFEKIKDNSKQNRALVDEIILTDNELESITPSTSFSGAYGSQKELEKYFQTLFIELEKYAGQLHNPISLNLENMTHGIHIGFDPVSKRWFCANANRLPPTWINTDNKNHIHDIASWCYNAFFEKFKIKNGVSTSANIIFSTEIHCYESDKFILNEIISNWRDNKEMKNLHVVDNNRLNMCDSRGYTWLHIATLMNDVPLIKAMLHVSPCSTHCSYDYKDINPFMLAVSYGYADIVNEMINCNQNKAENNILKYNENGISALFTAIIMQREDILQNFLHLIKNTVQMHQMVCYEFSLLCLAILFNNSPQMITILLNKGFDPNQKSQDGATPLLCAVIRGDKNIAEQLLQRGAKIEDIILNEDNTENFLEKYSDEITKPILKQIIEKKISASGQCRLSLIELAQAINKQAVIPILASQEPKLNSENIDKSSLFRSEQNNVPTIKNDSPPYTSTKPPTATNL